ncbi:protein adenylyltransferase SelO [Vibrio methylphosphonaticus]|uniref:protein adenylyltransferase SelO n=1 Tax=Vibrio methylphosphonaticus TaxID=2946866 RepID=UPI00202A9311|nr:YdiU family protein [Vibrio methylphosphonaticus]MCL9776152.1 YdiU family protein [Vibrio methylphosphonaticus]
MSVWDRVHLSTRFAEFPASFYTSVNPKPLITPQWVAWNGDLAKQLQLPQHADDHPELLMVLSGIESIDGLSPLAMKYAGHQFGVYNPDLGDGRGLLLGEIIDVNGVHQDVHIKGAGKTPYSRMGDGRAVLRSTIREYLCSEAMYGLGIATTRALGMMASETPVYREKAETGALLVRVAESHIRFGHFEHFFYSGQHSELKLLLDKVIEWHFPNSGHQTRPYAHFLDQVVTKTAQMIAQWQSVGFAHGVMNTDNMSVLGQTFDYGPFAFLDDYEPGYICNHSDYQGRYAFNNQPSIALWNLTALAHALSPFIERSELDKALEGFTATLQTEYSKQMRAKFGLLTKQSEDGGFFNDAFEFIERHQVDFTLFFRALSNLDKQGSIPVLDLFRRREEAEQWLEGYERRASLEPLSIGERCDGMRAVNPKYILRNYLAQQAIEEAEQGDFSMVNTLLSVLKTPYDEHPELSILAAPPPEWGQKMTISCSS